MTLPQLETRSGWESQPAASGEESPAAAVSSPRACDPLAVAVGNASLFGVGYVLLGRRWVAGLTTAVTFLLVAVLAVAVRTLWLELVVVAWWGTLIAHGWRLARRQPQRRQVGRQRLVALAFALPVLLVFGLLRVGASGIEDEAAQARANGDCEAALAALDQLWVGHDVVNAPLSARGDDTMRACDLLTRSASDLNAVLKGNTKALETAFGRFAFVLDNLPGHEKMVQTTLDGFLDRLPTKGAGCKTLDVVDWLRDKHAGGPLRRATTIVPKVAPAALLGCGDALLGGDKWVDARTTYQRLLDQYPDHKFAAKATQGVKQATLGLELSTVRQLLAAPSKSGSNPAYCDTPVPYSGAPPYGGGGANRALIYGESTYSNQIPELWRATDPSHAVIVICADESTYGTAVDTCSYTTESTGISGWVTFYKIAIPMRIYELRTGRLLGQTTMEISGVSCPPFFTSYGAGLGPPSQQYVEPSTGDIHTAFTPVIYP